MRAKLSLILLFFDDSLLKVDLLPLNRRLDQLEADSAN